MGSPGRRFDVKCDTQSYVTPPLFLGIAVYSIYLNATHRTIFREHYGLPCLALSVLLAHFCSSFFLKGRQHETNNNTLNFFIISFLILWCSQMHQEKLSDRKNERYQREKDAAIAKDASEQAPPITS